MELHELCCKWGRSGPTEVPRGRSVIHPRDEYVCDAPTPWLEHHVTVAPHQVTPHQATQHEATHASPALRTFDRSPPVRLLQNCERDQHTVPDRQ